MRLDWRQTIPALLLGCMLGLWAGHWVTRAAHERMLRRGPDTQRLLKKFNAELKLDAKQQEAVKAVLESHSERMKALHEESLKHLEETRVSLRQDMARILDPEQQKKFQDMQARWNARHKNWR